MKLPKIPTSVYSVLGQVPVEQSANIPTPDGTPSGDLGWWDALHRTIRVRNDMPPATTWHTLLHEKVHMWLWDAGVGLDDAAEERVCDAIATAILAERLNAPHTRQSP